MIVTLIGYRGCGKSSVGPLLADRLGCRCADSDLLIEQRAGKSIARIFAEDGEPAFRSLESEVLNDLLTQPSLVIAAGGGAILSEANRQRMRQAGPVVWLKASPATLAARITGDVTSAARRPSLTGKSIADEVAEVLTFREPLYAGAASLIIDAENQTPQQIVEFIVMAVWSPENGSDS
ncbi:MAG: shikimate kinase AroL [Planctomycetaceae bacterium]